MEARIRVESYSGYRSNERPLRFTLGTRVYQVRAVEERWYEPDGEYFSVATDAGGSCLLHYRPKENTWTLEKAGFTSDLEPGNDM